MAENRLDVIIFGATGFTGNYTVKEAARLSKAKPFSWGIAGRNKERLNAVLKKFAPEEENISVIIADVKDEESLKKMAEKCKVVVNCCGPYRFYGEPVIKACIAAGTHHVDVSGEPQFMEKMQVEHSKAAQEAGVYVISACGFDSIPCDLGIIFVQQKFGGEVNSVETYLKSKVDGNFKGAVLHYGTWESAVYGLAHADELRELRSKLFPNKLPSFKPKLHPRGILHRSEISRGWSLPFPGSDRSYPKFFSGGLASHEGPSPEAMEKTYFSITLKAKGWKDKLTEPTDKHTEPPNKEVIAKVSGTNPGYGATCTMLMISALTVLREADKLPDNGGVLPPGAAFANTSMIEQLNNNGVKFEIIKAE
ncbi:hypothetical protein G9C98_002649 [Cotesia typhae]|uniref:Saccharopine dehydrogenase NADP binding domain-containing protein n=1 Tax=Cotesia typhae TaxID=2053667 RepID=A0A8J5VBI0_9HYME|nr:hypothetical protein G9C98_002649 [Cotesia typhae]